MGQRHQLYFRVKKQTGIPPEEETKVFGYHHQWLWGVEALNTLTRVLKAYEASNQYHPLKSNHLGFEYVNGCLEALISSDYQTGYYHEVWAFQGQKDPKHNEPTCILDPRKGHNNNGITIVDFADKYPKYCFMSIGHLECLKEGARYKNFEPISAAQWFSLHYDLEKLQYDGHKNATFLKRALEYVSYLDTADILTLEEVKEIFPAMFEDNQKIGQECDN